VRDDRVVQLDRRRKVIRDAQGVREKFGVAPELIPDFLGLVGDAADGYPGMAGIGAVTAAQLLNRHGPIEAFPPALLGDRQPLALMFKRLATLVADAPLFDDVESLRWRGPTDAFAPLAAKMNAASLVERAMKAAARVSGDARPAA
jgi:5'-3' exonuclease